MQEYKEMFKNFFAFFLGDFGSRVLSFIMIPFYTGILSTAQYGEIDLITSTVNLIIPLITLNCADSVFRFVMSKNENKKSVFTTGMFICSVGLLFFLVFIYLFKKYVTNYVIFLYLLTLVSIIHAVLNNYAKAVGNIKMVSFVGFINTFLFISFNIIALKFLALGVDGYLLSSILSSFIVIVILVIYLKAWKLFDIKSVNFSIFKSMAKYSLPLIPTNMCWWIVMLSDRYMINWMLGTNYAGLYAVANKVPTILQAVLTIFIQAWQISSTSVYEDNEEQVKKYFETTLKYSQGIIFILSSFMIIGTQAIMFIIAKNDFYSGWNCAPFLILCISFSFINGIITSIYIIYKQNLHQFYSVFFGAAFNIIVNYILIIKIGIIGATISSCASYLIIMMSRLKHTENLMAFNRHYKLIITNSVVIISQALLYIYVDNYILKYTSQLIALSYIVYNNRFIFINRKREYNVNI